MTGQNDVRRRSSGYALRHKTLLSLGALLVTFGVGFLALEAWVRLSQTNIDILERTGIRKVAQNPMAEWALTDAFSAYRARPGVYRAGLSKGSKTVNRYGFISTPEIEVAKPSATTRIAFLGGSATAGTGRLLGDEETWPWRTVDALRQFAHGQWDFINAGIGGYSSFESYGRLWSRLRFFSPDVVIVNHGWNEMYYFRSPECLYLWRTQPDGSWDMESAFDQTFATHRPLWIDTLLRPSQVLTRIRLRYGRYPNGEIGPTGEEPSSGSFRQAEYFGRCRSESSTEGRFERDALEVWRTNVRLLRDSEKSLGFKVFFLKQPILIVSGLPQHQRANIGYGLHGFGHEEHVKAYHEIYRVIDTEVDPNRIIDATSLSGRPELFFDHVHLTVQVPTSLASSSPKRSWRRKYLELEPEASRCDVSESAACGCRSRDVRSARRGRGSVLRNHLGFQSVLRSRTALPTVLAYVGDRAPAYPRVQFEVRTY